MESQHKKISFLDSTEDDRSSMQPSSPALSSCEDVLSIWDELPPQEMQDLKSYFDDCLDDFDLSFPTTSENTETKNVEAAQKDSSSSFIPIAASARNGISSPTTSLSNPKTTSVEQTHVRQPSTPLATKATNTNAPATQKISALSGSSSSPTTYLRNTAGYQIIKPKSYKSPLQAIAKQGLSSFCPSISSNMASSSQKITVGSSLLSASNRCLLTQDTLSSTSSKSAHSSSSTPSSTPLIKSKKTTSEQTVRFSTIRTQNVTPGTSKDCVSVLSASNAHPLSICISKNTTAPSTSNHSSSSNPSSSSQASKTKKTSTGQNIAQRLSSNRSVAAAPPRNQMLSPLCQHPSRVVQSQSLHASVYYPVYLWNVSPPRTPWVQVTVPVISFDNPLVVVQLGRFYNQNPLMISYRCLNTRRQNRNFRPY